MKHTITNARKQPQRICLNCGVGYDAGNAKRVYCSDKCRVDNHRKKQIQIIQHHEETVNEQKTLIQQLTDAPVKRIETIQVINPAWQVAKQAYAAQFERCHNLEAQLKSVSAIIHKQKGGKIGAYIVTGIFVSFVFILMATRFDDRKLRPLGLTFGVCSLIGLIGMGMLGYWFGQQIQADVVSGNKRIATELMNLTQQSVALTNELEAERNKLAELRQDLVKLPNYESEKITSTNEVRDTSLVANNLSS